MSNRVKRTPQRPSRLRVQQRAESSRRRLIAAVGAGLVVATFVIIAIVATNGSDDGEGAGAAFNGVALAPFAAGADDTAVGQKAPLFVTEDVNGTRVVTVGGGGPNDTAKVIAFVAHWCQRNSGSTW